MKVTAAITILQDQKLKLQPLTDYKNVSWKTHLVSLVKDFFGEDSVEYKKICEKPFYRKEEMFSQYGVYYEYEIDKNFYNDFIDNCIQSLKIKGLYKKPKRNFLQKINNRAILSIGGSLLLAAFGIGVWVGQTNTKAEAYDKLTASPASKEASPRKTSKDTLNKH